MRIISGSLKGRKFPAPKGLGIRPTSDKVKGSIFNILGIKVEGAVVLDLFAGCGTLGIEALSRGAHFCWFVESDRLRAAELKKNLVNLNLEGVSEVLSLDFARGLRYLINKGLKFNIIFADPPYEKGFVARIFSDLNIKLLTYEDSSLVIERSKREPLPDISPFELYNEKVFGDTYISFLKVIS